MLTITKVCVFVLKGNWLIIDDFLLSHDQSAFCLDRDVAPILEPNSKQWVKKGTGDSWCAFFPIIFMIICELL